MPSHQRSPAGAGRFNGFLRASSGDEKLSGRHVREVDGDVLDGKVKELALEGKLRRAAQQAVRRQKARGLAITYLRGDEIVRRTANGEVEVLGKVEVPAFEFPSNVKVLKK